MVLKMVQHPLEDAAFDRLSDVPARHCRSTTTAQDPQRQLATSVLRSTAERGHLDVGPQLKRGHWLSLLEIEFDGIGRTACC